MTKQIIQPYMRRRPQGSGSKITYNICWLVVSSLKFVISGYMGKFWEGGVNSGDIASPSELAMSCEWAFVISGYMGNFGKVG